MFSKLPVASGDPKIPTRATVGSAGYDLTAINTVHLPPHTQGIVHTGIAVALPPGVVGLLCSRSGHGVHGVRLANCVGVIDEDYEGEILVMIRNDSSHPMTIWPGERIAQLVPVQLYMPPEVSVEPASMSVKRRGTKGLGSTGK